MKKMKNNLDERQEKQLLHIEKNGCWFAFWALLLSIFIQQGIFGFQDFKAVIGEWVIFILLNIYLMGACFKNGIWDRHLKADPKTNLKLSIIAALLFSAIISMINYLNYKEWQASVITFGIMTIFIFGLCFAALSACTILYKKREKKLDSRYEDIGEEK